VAARDVVVIGGGIAGVSAALECFDIQLDVLLIEAGPAPGGQVRDIPHDVRNVVALSNGTAGLLQAVADNSARLADRLVLGTPVTAIDLEQGKIAAGPALHEARMVVIATGSHRRELGLAPDGALGGDVTYLLEPHLDRFAGRPAIVVGGGDSAVLDALTLADTGSQVTLVHRGRGLTARRDLVSSLRSEQHITDLSGWAVEQLLGSGRLEGVVVADVETGEQRTLEGGALVLKLGREPQVDLVRGQVELGARGGIAADPELRTSHPRAVAAGDVVEGAYERIATAMGQGALAARTVLRQLDGHR
jgi:thioredoxin reductase (NADPH)